jgi:hypothetical protein
MLQVVPQDRFLHLPFSLGELHSSLPTTDPTALIRNNQKIIHSITFWIYFIIYLDASDSNDDGVRFRMRGKPQNNYKTAKMKLT